MRIVHFVMRLAPFAVFAIIFNTAFTFGTAVFASLFFYVVTVVARPAACSSSACTRNARRSSPGVRRSSSSECRDVYLYAFSTASSNATLPLSLEVAEDEARFRRTSRGSC